MHSVCISYARALHTHISIPIYTDRRVRHISTVALHLAEQAGILRMKRARECYKTRTRSLSMVNKSEYKAGVWCGASARRSGKKKGNYEFVMANRSSAAINYSRIAYACHQLSEYIYGGFRDREI